MPFTPEIVDVNQRLQFGAESTSALGTSVAASKILQCYDVYYQPKGDTNFYRPTGRKYDNTQEQNTEWAEGSWSGTLDYNAVQYILAGLMGSVAPVAHLASATAKDWIYTPPVTGTVVPQTYTVEQGDSTYAKKSTYNLFTDFGYTLTRKKTDITAKSLSQALQTGITMTASPTSVAIAPVPGKHLNLYIDTTSAGLGTTQSLKTLQIQYAMGNVYNPFWPINRANTSYTSHVDTPPAATVKFLIEADATGMAFLAGWEAGTTYFLRVDALGTVAIATDGPGNIFNEFKHDMAIKLGEPSQFQNKDGVYAIEWNGRIVEDATWGKAQMVTVTNLITAL